jgi:hypothetical protein
MNKNYMFIAYFCCAQLMAAIGYLLFCNPVSESEIVSTLLKVFFMDNQTLNSSCANVCTVTVNSQEDSDSDTDDSDNENDIDDTDHNYLFIIEAHK